MFFIILLAIIVAVIAIVSIGRERRKEAQAAADRDVLEKVKREREELRRREQEGRDIRIRAAQHASASTPIPVESSRVPSPRLVDFSKKATPVFIQQSKDDFESQLNAITMVDIVPSDRVNRHMIENMREIKFANITRKTRACSH